MNPVWLAGGIFLITYALIVTERVHRTVSALLGGVAVILLGVLSQEEAFHAIDWNVIFLLAGMMVIANVLQETGLFQWIAIRAVKLGQGDPFRVLVILSVVIAVIPHVYRCWRMVPAQNQHNLTPAGSLRRCAPRSSGIGFWGLPSQGSGR